MFCAVFVSRDGYTISRVARRFFFLFVITNYSGLLIIHVGLSSPLTMGLIRKNSKSSSGSAKPPSSSSSLSSNKSSSSKERRHRVTKSLSKAVRLLGSSIESQVCSYMAPTGFGAVYIHSPVSY